MTELFEFAGGIAAVLLVIGPVLDRVIFPERTPGPEFLPDAGQVFRSESEGFTQRVVRRERNLFWTELTMGPYAPGPPAHVHTGFAERFRVERGTVSIRLVDRVVELHAGQEYLVEAGVVHQPFNSTGEDAVVMGLGEEFALPERFGVFLTQAYGFFDARRENREAPRALLQMSRFSPAYDVWLGGPPVAAQRALYWVLGPVARVLGYRTHYPQYAPAGAIEEGSLTAVRTRV